MYLMNIISSIGEHYLSWRHVYNVIGSVLAILMAYKTVYSLLESLNPRRKNINMLF